MQMNGTNRGRKLGRVDECPVRLSREHGCDGDRPPRSCWLPGERRELIGRPKLAVWTQVRRRNGRIHTRCEQQREKRTQRGRDGASSHEMALVADLVPGCHATGCPTVSDLRKCRKLGILSSTQSSVDSAIRAVGSGPRSRVPRTGPAGRLCYASMHVHASMFAIVFALLGCSANAVDVPETAATAAAADGTDTDVDPEAAVRARLRLEQRSFPLLIWAAHATQEQYFDKSRFDPRFQLATALDYIGLHEPEVFASVEGAVVSVAVGSHIERFSLDELPDVLSAAERLETVLQFVNEVLRLDDDAKHELEYVAINGLLAPLDPHTVLLEPREHEDLGVRTKGEFGGIGAEIRAEHRRIVMVRVLPGSPAERAGVRTGDIILAIDRESTVNMSAKDAQQRLRGLVHTTVNVTLRRVNKTLDVAIDRDVIKIESVTSLRLPAEVGFVRIASFQENTGEQVRTALAALLAGTPPIRALVLDLRGDWGGLLTQATEVADQFVDDGELVIVRSAGGREAELASSDTMLPKHVPVVVLIDEQSASASEIVSGSLKQLGRAVIVGRTSFGKGTVQMLKPVTPYGQELALKLTIAEYLVAGDQRIQSLGVQPDLELLPVRLGPVAGLAHYYDLDRFERERERSRAADLPSGRHEAAPASSTGSLRLRYLWESPQLPNGLSEQERELQRHMEDAEIRIAHTVVRALADASDDDAKRKRFSSVVRDLGVTEEQRIVGALSRMRIDWRNHPEAQVPELGVNVRVVGEPRLLVGSTFVMQLELTNRASRAAQRVHVSTESSLDELDGIEWLIGSIAAGKTVTRNIELQVMPWHPDMSVPLTVKAHAGEHSGAASAQTKLEFRGAPRPALSFDYWIVDDPALAKLAPKRNVEPTPEGAIEFSVRGNGDGILQPDERVLLVVEARNDGRGMARDVRAMVRNRSGSSVLLEEGLVQLGRVRPGSRVRGSFGVTVAREHTGNDPVRLELIVGDAHARESVRDELDLPSQARGAARLRSQAGVSPPVLHLDPVPTMVEADRVLVRGRADHPVRVRDVMVAVLPHGASRAERKVFYRANPELDGPDARTMEFATEVPLERGANRITFIARDARKVQRELDLQVYRP